MISAPPLSLYLHLPWCVRKCPYCDFNSHRAGAGAETDRYVAALIRDLEQEAVTAGDRTIETVFLGGGTPSLFSPAEIGALLDAVDRSFRLAARPEITMEANPGTVERGRLPDYRLAGVNRLSLGAQSFNDGALFRLGRIHSSDDIRRAMSDAASAGFDSINLDLMFALPGQTLAAAADDLEQAILLAPAHISYYQLTLEPNTRFHAEPPADLPTDDLAFVIEAQAMSLLAAAGYRRYEVSAFAKEGFRCRHNLNYWTFGDYLGVGAGAHGKLTRGDGSVWRSLRPAHPRAYMEQVEAGRLETEARRIGAADLGFEFLLNALRLEEGFTEAAFAARTGLPFSAVLPEARRARALRLLSTDRAGGWRPSRRGRRFLNDLQAMFLPDQSVTAAGAPDPAGM
jgi:putative oxygen-independent coproporphyrinogen III oxidase